MTEKIYSTENRYFIILIAADNESISRQISNIRAKFSKEEISYPLVVQGTKV